MRHGANENTSIYPYETMFVRFSLKIEAISARCEVIADPQRSALHPHR